MIDKSKNDKRKNIANTGNPSKEECYSLSLAEDLSGFRVKAVIYPNGLVDGAFCARHIIEAVVEYLIAEHREELDKYIKARNPRYIVRDSARAKELQKRKGAICFEFLNGEFYFYTNCLLSNVGKNLRDLISGCGLKPSEFILVNSFALAFTSALAEIRG